MCVHHYSEYTPQKSGTKWKTSYSIVNTSLDKSEHGFNKLESTGH